MEDESEAAQGQTTATGNASLGASRESPALSETPVRPRSAPSHNVASSIRKEFRKGALQKEVDASCPLKAAKPVYRHQHHSKKAFAEFNKLRRYSKQSNIF